MPFVVMEKLCCSFPPVLLIESIEFLRDFVAGDRNLPPALSGQVRSLSEEPPSESDRKSVV